MEGWTGVEGWNGMGHGMGWRAWLLPAPFGEKEVSFLELSFRAGFDTAPGRAVERSGKGWRTADAVHYLHYPVGLGEPDTQCLLVSNFVSAMSGTI